jgi:SOS regulatory protein LexA
MYGDVSADAAPARGQQPLPVAWLSPDAWHTYVPVWRCYRVQLLGVVEAGFPSPAEEELLDTISLDDYLISRKEASYILRVKGDSMINAGILPGDMIIVERTTAALDGDIVIAEVDGQWTMKYFRKHGNRVALEAANPKYQPIVPQQELRIAAVVRAVVRKY